MKALRLLLILLIGGGLGLLAVPLLPQPAQNWVATEQSKVSDKVDDVVKASRSGENADDSPPTTPIPTSDLQQLRQYMLDLINADRTKAGLRPVALGSNTAAQQHAEDMLRNFYLGHIDSGGMKPYMRYTLAGGLGAVGENAGYSGTQDPSHRTRYANLDPKEELQQHEHGMVHDDAASNWGHRDNILEPQHQVVNIGIAYDRTRLALSQQFEERYVSFSQPPSLANGILTLAGSLDPSVGRLGIVCLAWVG